MWSILQKSAFAEALTSEELNTFKNAWGISESGGTDPETPVDPDITLSSISAAYTGGDVTVGTALTSLTDITVTATYSDGSTANVTGYTLSGEIIKGENTITVTYQSKTATFVVTGVIESSNTTYYLKDIATSVNENVNLTDVAADGWNSYVEVPVESGDIVIVYASNQYINFKTTSFSSLNGSPLTASDYNIEGYVVDGVNRGKVTVNVPTSGTLSIVSYVNDLPDATLERG